MVFEAADAEQPGIEVEGFQVLAAEQSLVAEVVDGQQRGGAGIE